MPLFLFKKLKNYLFFISIPIADFSWGLNNKKVLNSAFAAYQDIFASADNADLGLNNSEYPAQPHPIILKYCRH